MSLRRRLLLYLLVSAPLVWAVALYVSVDRARREVNELFDTEMIRLARQVHATLVLPVARDEPVDRPLSAPAPVSVLQPAPRPVPQPAPVPGTAGAGAADVGDLAIAAWDETGRRLITDGEGVQLPRRVGASGFVEERLAGEPWRVYYERFAGDGWLVAAGQTVEERDELVFSLTASQVVPWLAMLPVLLAAMAWAVRNALAPLHRLAADIEDREPGDLQPVPEDQAPSELKPLVAAMNALFGRIGQALERERRFTADAAHELRTPLAFLRAQWDVVRRAGSDAERAQAEAKLGAGLERMDRLVTQMLALSQVESATQLPHFTEVRWPAVVEQAVNECLALAERRRMEIACEWPPPRRHPLPLLGDEHLLTVLLRNLLDNALRYAPAGTTVTLRMDEDRLTVENDGPPLAAGQLAHLGERFRRDDGQAEVGSGLGVSIVQRIAALHGLAVSFGARDDGQGVRVGVAPLAPAVSTRADSGKKRSRGAAA